MSFGWALFWLLVGIVLSIISYAINMATRNPDFDMDDSEETSGVINVKANNTQSDANRMREQFDDDGA